MLKLISWILRAVLALAVLLILAVIIVPQIIDPNDYRAELAELVEQQTGRELDLQGDLSISVFPWLGLRTQGVTFAQPAEIGGTMLSVKQAQLRVKVLPLLSKRIEIDTIVLAAPQLRMVTLPNGVSSLTGLFDTSTQQEDAQQLGTASAALIVQGLALTDGQLIWDDRQAGSRYDVADFNLVSGNLIGDSLADLSASGSVLIIDHSSSKAVDPLAFKFDSQARIDTKTLRMTMQNAKATAQNTEQTWQLSLAQLLLEQSGKIQLEDLRARLATQALNQQILMIDLPRLTANLESQDAQIGSVDFKVANMSAQLNKVRITQFSDAPKLTARLYVPEFNAQQWLNTLGIDFQPSQATALQALSLNATLNANLASDNTQAQVNDLRLTLDQSQVNGNATIRDFAQAKVDFDISLDELNLDNYLPEQQASEESVNSAHALAVPIAAFKDVFANGRFRAEQIISGGLQLNDIDVVVKSTPGNVTITPTAQLYEGKLGGQIAYSHQGEQQQLRIKNEIDLVNLSQMLTAADITEQLSGIGSLALDLLVTEQDGVQSNTGTIKLQAKNGALKGVNIIGIVESAYQQYQAIKGRQVIDETSNTSQEGDETRFAELIGTFNLNDFKITNNDFLLKAPYFRADGKGEIDIAQQTLDYVVDLTIVKSSQGQGGEAVNKLKGITLPIRFRGDLTSPKYSLDVKSLYNSLIKRELNEKKGEYLQEKLGIEGGETLSTKDAVKQAVINKLFKKDQDDPQTEEPTEKDQLKDELVESLLGNIFN